MCILGKITDLDAGKDLSWQFGAGFANVISSRYVTKQNQEFSEVLVLHKDTVILHVTCSGYGGTKFEPKVPKTQDVVDGVVNLIQNGFPVSHMVLRIDPIIPNAKGIENVIKVLGVFRGTGISRVRLRFIEFTKRIKENFISVFGRIPCNGMVTDGMRKDALERITSYGFYEFEVCPTVGCLSNKDLFILGLGSVCGTRNDCACVSGTEDLLTTKWCDACCIYCRR